MCADYSRHKMEDDLSLDLYMFIGRASFNKRHVLLDKSSLLTHGSTPKFQKSLTPYAKRSFTNEHLVSFVIQDDTK
jgi:hypothetical protein